MDAISDFQLIQATSSEKREIDHWQGRAVALLPYLTYTSDKPSEDTPDLPPVVFMADG